MKFTVTIYEPGAPRVIRHCTQPVPQFTGQGIIVRFENDYGKIITTNLPFISEQE